MSRPLLSLIGVFKNESASIERVVESARAAGADHFTLLDTGSTDGTIDVLCRIRGLHGNDRLTTEPAVPFREIPSMPIDFAATRNLVLDKEASRKDAAVFCIMLSGDEEIVEIEPGALRKFLEQHRDTDNDAFSVTMRSDKRNSSWPSPRVLRVNGGRRYRYPIHEVPVGKNGERGGDLIPGVIVKYDEGNQENKRQRFLNVDIPLLEYAVAQDPGDDHEKHLERARALFYLGQTHEHLATFYKNDDPSSPWLTHTMQAMSYYMRRADLEGDEVDKNYCLFHYFDLAFKASLYTHEEMISRLEALVKLDPRRPEVRYRLAFHASQIDPRRAAFFALWAEQTAREARENPLPYSTDSRIEVLAIQIQAECAKILGQVDLAKRTAMRGLLLGGPKEMFSEYIDGSAA